MLIKNMLEDIGDEGINAENPIPIPNVCNFFQYLTFSRLTCSSLGERGRSSQGD